MQRVSMTSDLAATSPLLLQLLIPQGFTLQSRSAQTQSQTQAPLAPAGPPAPSLALSPRSRPPDQSRSHTPAPGSGNNPHQHFFCFFFLSDYNKQPCEKPNSGTAEAALCPGSRHSMRGSQHAGVPHTYEAECVLRGINMPRQPFLLPPPFVFYYTAPPHPSLL